jgi:hypothetical protein
MAARPRLTPAITSPAIPFQTVYITDQTVKNYINHILFVIDASGSMTHLSDSVVRVFDNQIKHLAKRSVELNQETRVTVILFSDGIRCAIFDTDVLRLPSLKSIYRTSGNTALIDATITSVTELSKAHTSFGDHAFLGYVLTDGEENHSLNKAVDLRKLLAKLPENWTLAVLVPDARGRTEAESFGFSRDNIAVWSTTTQGMDDVGDRVRDATDAYMQARTTGVRGTKSLFTLGTTGLTTNIVKAVLDEIPTTTFRLLAVRSKTAIRDFVEAGGYNYVAGCAYYQLSKPEMVQANKAIMIRDRLTAKVYGGTQARDLLGLPNKDVKVQPGNFTKYDIFVQSTSYNRMLVPNTVLLITV